MQNVLDRYTYRFLQRYTLIGTVARIAAAELIGKASTNQVQLDPAVRLRLMSKLSGPRRE
ncbi:hypothetical protein C7455_11727 [Roseicyclus mahoneyensis]|uniref:Uncharacterized protein n=2 Tax=Roseicyclus mahoneyensis TaxID=164332 RepID=A0A316G4F0_9RHOB|nr:hypothetical protein C7455_11727 [Roseicyclus mahoneyensis]